MAVHLDHDGVADAKRGIVRLIDVLAGALILALVIPCTSRLGHPFVTFVVFPRILPGIAHRSSSMPGIRKSSHEYPIQRPAAATVNHRASDTAPTTLPRTPGSPPSARATRSRTAKVKRSATGSVIIFTQNEVL